MAHICSCLLVHADFMKCSVEMFYFIFIFLFFLHFLLIFLIIIMRPCYVSAHGHASLSFVPPRSAFSWKSCKVAGFPRGVMSTETAFLAQTHAVSERSSSVSWDSAELTSKTDLPSVPAFPEALGWLATVQGGKRQSNNLWLISHVLPVTHTHTKPRLNKRDFIL